MSEPRAIATGLPRISKLSNGRWFMEWNCGGCMDSGIEIDMFKCIDQCRKCQASLGKISYRLYGCLCDLMFRHQEIDDTMLTMARVLVSANAEAPILGECLADFLECSERQVKKTAKRLRDEWRLPAVGTRQPPYGYFFAATPEEFLAWMRTTKSQAISELATAYQLFKANFPALAGQQSIQFIDEVSTELKEAIR
jgi:hypothetical protein